MLIWESIIIALRALTASKLRTILTMLGIIIGVGAVISLVSIGNGVRESFNQQIAGLGTNVLWLSSGQRGMFGKGRSSNEENTTQKPAIQLTMADFEVVSNPAIISDMVDVAAEYRPSANRVVRQQVQMQGNVLGVTPSYAAVRNYIVSVGEFLSDDHIARRDFSHPAI